MRGHRHPITGELLHCQICGRTPVLNFLLGLYPMCESCLDEYDVRHKKNLGMSHYEIRGIMLRERAK
mgnify:CR=1 FL=1